MSRRKNLVKNKHVRAARSTMSSHGLVDLHFHGAFGIDLLNADARKLNNLSSLLWEKGIAAFCPTTISMPRRELDMCVRNLGRWIRQSSALRASAAVPLGIHLEGPFINPEANGAHPASAIRPLGMRELEELWNASLGTIKVITVAPEMLTTSGMGHLARWARTKKVVLSIGHSEAPEAIAKKAFDAGFSGLTHAWNAMPFHHRSPGPLGAALGRQDVYVELIVDQVHVSPTIVDWMGKLHPGNLCFVSDCAPAAGTKPGSIHSFGPLRVMLSKGACRVADGLANNLAYKMIAGAGLLLSDAYLKWVSGQASGNALVGMLKATLPNVTTNPLKALGLRPAKHPKLRWEIEPVGGSIRYSWVRS